MNQDTLVNALDQLIHIVGKEYSVTSENTEKFSDYLRDETYLKGSASLVLRPETQAQVIEIVREANHFRQEYPSLAPDLGLTIRGGGSGLSGACVPARGVVLDMTRLNTIIDINERDQTMRAESGVILSELNATLAGSPLHYAVDPSSAQLCTLGGSIATNAAGPSSLKYGTTRQNIAKINLLTANGDTIHAGYRPNKTSMGFSMSDLICGSEGRLGIVLEAEVRLQSRPEAHFLAIAGFKTESAAVDFIREIRLAGLRPRNLEILDGYCISLVDFPVDHQIGAVLMIEFDGMKTSVEFDLEKLVDISPSLDWSAARDEKSRLNFWAKRKSITATLKHRFPFKLGEDVAVPLSALAHTMSFARRRAAEQDIQTAIWGHAGDGNLHINYLLNEEGLLPKLAILMRELAVEVTRIGGAISGEHGLGRLKLPFAVNALGADHFNWQKKIKHAFDPHLLFNPALEALQV
jgi:FAD/FMN-containing dehydrogenase